MESPGNLVATHTIVLPDQVEISQPALAHGLSDPFKPMAGLPMGMTLGGLELQCGLVNVTLLLSPITELQDNEKTFRFVPNTSLSSMGH
jgi:hypothetical protein